MSTPATSLDKENTGWNHSSTCRAVQGAGEAEGRAYGLAEARSRTLARLLKSQAKQCFGGTDPAGRATLDSLAQAFACDELEELADSLVKASGWSEWLAGVFEPPPAPGLPDYTKDVEIDFEPSGPSIDSHMKVTFHGGREGIVHLRFQKIYQPDLDRHLFEETAKLERKFGQEVIVCVILMWPPAEGPGTTGRFEQRDEKGKVKRVFTYTLRRAWEIPPEELTQTVGTMLMAPLSRGAGSGCPRSCKWSRRGWTAMAPTPGRVAPCGPPSTGRWG